MSLNHFFRPSGNGEEMKKIPKKLQKAFNQTDKLSKDWFGEEMATFDELPSVSSKKEIIRTSTYLKEEDLDYLKNVSKKTKVSVAQLTGDIVHEFIKRAKNKKV